jgi:hypothetical protein
VLPAVALIDVLEDPLSLTMRDGMISGGSALLAWAPKKFIFADRPR